MATQTNKLNPTFFVSILSTILLILWAILHVVRHLSLWRWLTQKIFPLSEEDARIQAGGICPP